MTTASDEPVKVPAHPQWTFADRLRKAREIAGLGQAGMARALGLNTSATYTNWESRRANRKGVRPLPEDILETAERIEYVTGVPRMWILFGEEAPQCPTYDEQEMLTISEKVLASAWHRRDIELIQELVRRRSVTAGDDSASPATGAALDAERRKQTLLMQQRRSATHPAAGADTPSWTPVGHVA